MSMIRPEILAHLLRWREAIIGGVVVAGGLYMAATSFGIMRYLAFIAIAAGLALIWEGVRRARFPAQGGGPGLVEVDERQITYFGPGGGSSVSIDDLVRVEVMTTDQGPFVSDLFWVFQARGGASLTVPGDAEQAESLFDALAALPGVNYEAATAAATSTEPAVFLIWAKEQQKLH